MLHVDHLFLYLSRDGLHKDRDFHGSGSHSQPVAMHQSSHELWTRRPDPSRDNHRVSSFEHFPRRRSAWQSRPRSPAVHYELPVRQSRPRSPAVHYKLPVKPKPPSLLSMGTLSNPFADNRHRRYPDKKQLPESCYSGDRFRPSMVVESRTFRATADSVAKHDLRVQSADCKYQSPRKQEAYHHYDWALHGYESSAADTKQRVDFVKLPRDKQRRDKWIGARHSSEDSGKQKRIPIPATERTLPHEKKNSDSTLAGQSERYMKKTPYATADCEHAAKAKDKTPAKTLTSDDSTAAIRPEDIIIIRRYDLDSLTMEKLPENSGQTAKRHVVRLVRNNVMSPLTAAGLDVGDHTESVGGQGSVVKKRCWGGIVKKMDSAENYEGNTVVRRGVDDRTHQDHNRR